MKLALYPNAAETVKKALADEIASAASLLRTSEAADTAENEAMAEEAMGRLAWLLGSRFRDMFPSKPSPR